MSASLQRLGGAALAAAAVLAAPLASAAGPSASASLTGYTIELIDLDPNDGIIPAIYQKALSVVTYSQRMNGPRPEMDYKIGYNSSEVVHQPGSARTRIDAVSADARAEASDTTSRFSASNDSRYAFILSPNTALHISGLTEVSLSGAHPEKISNAFVWLRGELSGDDDPVSRVEILHSARTDPGSRNLYAVLQSGDAWTTGRILLNVNAGVNYPLVPVPEPSTYAMLLAGLGLLGWHARRSRS